MTILSLPVAKYFVGLYSDRNKPNIDDIDEYLVQEIGNNKRIFSETDGTLEPIVYLLTKQSENCFYLSLSNFVRGLEILGTGLGNWAHVTFYYSSFYSAKSILALHGGWAKDYKNKYWATQVDSPTQTDLKLKVTEWKHNGQKINSHRAFWSYFYESMKNITNYVPSQYSPALSPINNDVFWMTTTRNKLNYQISSAVNINSQVLSNLDASAFPYCLPRDLATQYNQARNLVTLANHLLHDFNINSDAFSCINSMMNRGEIIEQYLYGRVDTELEAYNLKNNICSQSP
jgi:hypothetical protein